MGEGVDYWDLMEILQEGGGEVSLPDLILKAKQRKEKKRRDEEEAARQAKEEEEAPLREIERQREVIAREREAILARMQSSSESSAAMISKETEESQKEIERLKKETAGVKEKAATAKYQGEMLSRRKRKRAPFITNETILTPSASLLGGGGEAFPEKSGKTLLGE